MDKIISFDKGIRRQPSIGEDGELSELVNLIPKNGELVNIKPMEVDKNRPSMNDGYTLLAMHNVRGGTNYIASGEGLLVSYQYDGAEWVKEPIGVETTDTTRVGVIGNVIVATSDSSTKYVVFKDGKYHVLGDSLPELSLSFGLIREEKGSDDISFVATSSEEFIQNAYPMMLEFISNNSKSRFMNPFFVRYAYRLYDDSLVMHSSPILMMPATEDVAFFWATMNSVSIYKGGIVSYVHQLSYKANDDDVIEHLKDYADIIKSVDIFISRPINLFGNEEDDTILLNTSPNEDKASYGISAPSIDGDFAVSYLRDLLPPREEYLYAISFRRPSEAVFKEISDCSTFHLFKSLRIDELKDSMTILSVDEGEVIPTETERMSDDFKTHEKVVASQSFTYNSRLHLFGAKAEMFKGYDVRSMFPYVSSGDNSDMQVYIHLRKNGVDYVVSNISRLIAFDTAMSYLYYPDPDAYKATVRMKGYVWEVPLVRHDFLYGAYYFNGFNKVRINGDDGEIPTGVNEGIRISHPNMIYVSNAGNPFYFPVSGHITVGLGSVLGLATNVKAVSPSQFGQFPLYVFCTDAIWALEVTKEGSYLPAKVVSNDICNNANSITPLEDSIIFTTEQGLKLIQGSEVELLSGHMDGHNIEESYYFPNGLFSRYGEPNYESMVIDEKRDFRSILATCSIAYDYPNRLLRIFPKGGEKWYVYSIDTNEFSTELSSGEVTNIATGYPYTLVQIGNDLFGFHNGTDNTIREGLLLSRPIDMGEPFALKKLQDVRLHYTKHSKSTYAKIIIYVSNDSINWHILPSLRKRSFKYYRIALITRMTGDDRLSGMGIRYELERTNKLR